jgi:hypothetical protein
MVKRKESGTIELFPRERHIVASPFRFIPCAGKLLAGIGKLPGVSTRNIKRHGAAIVLS